MKKGLHRVYLSTFVLIVLAVLALLVINGYAYYKAGLENRVFSDQHDLLKPSGNLGHGLGIIGSSLIIIGIATYMARKRYRFLSKVGLLKHWLEFHIFLCVLGPIMILFHTAFKFGGIVAISFWSMVAVVLSGVIGRFIYLQIPRTIEGRELSLNEASTMKKQITQKLLSSFKFNTQVTELLETSLNSRNEGSGGNIISRVFNRYSNDRTLIRTVRTNLRRQSLKGTAYRTALKLMKNEINLNRRIDLLVSMQNLLKYWHVAHMPFALVMLIIMVIHAGVTVLFGYHWIF